MLVCVAPAALHGDDWNLKTRFMVNQPFEVPGMVLQPNTRYIVRLLDSPSDRRIVQIYNNDETKMLTMFLAVSDERTEAADNTVFTFIETEPGYPVPIKEWFYPGRIHGLEFIYPRTQAVEIAQHAREPIRATSASDLHDLASVTVEAVEPIPSETATSTAANVTKSEVTQIAQQKPGVIAEDNTKNEEQAPAEIAQNNSESNSSNLKTQSEVQQEKPAESPVASEQSNTTQSNTIENKTVENNTTTEKKELPRTAGELPLIALIGALCLGAGLGMKVLSSKS